MAFLKIEKGSNPGQILELHGERMVLGRHPSCQIVLDNAAVSRQHAQILESHGTYFIEDLRSRNATLLNDLPVEGRMPLHDADRIRVCDVQFQFCEQAPAGDAAPVQKQRKSPPPHAQLRGAMPTIAAAPALPGLAIDDDSVEHSENSSIISTLDATSSSSVRLSIKPEAKLRAILAISSSLANTLDLDSVLQKILDGLFRIFPQADEGFILLKDPDKKKLLVKATKSRRFDAETRVRVSMTIVRQAMKTGEAILSADAVEDSRFSLSDSLTQLQIRSMMCVPMVGSSGVKLGVIQIDTKDLKQQFSQADLELLVAVASQASLAVENASLHYELLKQRDLERDLEFATQVQLGFLPNQRPKVDGYEFYDYYEAALRVGGDYFDYVNLPEGRVAIALADVAGKGVPAALLMARLYSSARFHLLTKASAAEAMTGLNGEIASSGLGHRFITCVIAVLDPQHSKVTIANAGHLSPLLRSSSGKVEAVARETSGMPLGVLSDQVFSETELPLVIGDSLLLYTDGITEAMNDSNEIYGTKRLTQFVSAAADSVEELIKGIVSEVDIFGNDRPQRDDMCLVGLRRVT